VQLDYQMPDPALRSLLTVHARVTEVAAERTEILPAMLPNLHVRLAGACRYGFNDGVEREAPRVALIGPTSAAYRMRLQPGFVMVGTGFLPKGWMALARVPPAELRDTLIDGADLWGRSEVENLCDALLHAGTPAATWSVLEGFLADRFRPCEDTGRSASRIIDDWLETSGDLRLDDLARTLDVGARHLRRLTLETHGVSPKTLAMKYRCLRAAGALALKGREGVDEALPLFADQAHLIRDFRRFIGWTPTAFLGGAQIVAAGTIRGRRLAGAARPLALLS